MQGEIMDKAELVVDLTERDPRWEMPPLSVDFLSGPTFERLNELGYSSASSGGDDDAGISALRDRFAKRRERWLLPWG